MTKEEITNLIIEKESLRETIYQLSTGDKRIDWELNELCKGLEKKIDEIDIKLGQEPVLTAEVMLELRETKSKYNKDFPPFSYPKKDTYKTNKINEYKYPEIHFPSKEAKEKYFKQLKSIGFEEIECSPTINMEDVKKRRFNIKE